MIRVSLVGSEMCIREGGYTTRSGNDTAHTVTKTSSIIDIGNQLVDTIEAFVFAGVSTGPPTTARAI